MTSRSYIVDFTEPGQVADVYQHFFQQYAFVLNTDDQLRLTTQVRIRFNFPDGHGTTLVARVVSVLPDGGYGLQLPDNATTKWLLEKAADYADRMERVRGLRKVEVPPVEATPAPVEKPEPPAESAGAPAPAPAPAPERLPERVVESAPEPQQAVPQEAFPGPSTKPLGPLPAAPPVPAESPVQEPQQATSQAPTPALRNVNRIEDPANLSEAELRRRVAELDVLVASGGDQTVHAAPPRSPQPEPPAPAAPPAAPQPPVPDGPSEDMLERVRNLSEKQKKKLAISGDQDERGALMLDPNTALHLWVFKNPGLTEKEVVRFAANPELAPDALNFLLQNRRWGTSARVAQQLVMNPQTPPEAIPNLLTVLPRNVLEKLADMPGVRHLVARQAKRILMERSY